jgi:peptide subunit release factor 1 (eRF1)
LDEVITYLKCESDSAITKYDVRDVRDCFQNALRNIIQRLKLQSQIPENGLAIFAGIFAENNSESEVLNVEEIIPPEPITTYFYFVNNHFRLDPLREMLRNQKEVGVVSMDSKEASFGLLNGERLEIIENITLWNSRKVWKGRIKPKTLRKRTGHGSHKLFSPNCGACYIGIS